MMHKNSCDFDMTFFTVEWEGDHITGATRNEGLFILEQRANPAKNSQVALEFHHAIMELTPLGLSLSGMFSRLLEAVLEPNKCRLQAQDIDWAINGTHASQQNLKWGAP